MPDWRAMRGPLGPGSVSIGTQPSSRSGDSSPSREWTKAQVLADARQRMSHLDAKGAQPLRLAEARQFQQLR
jgi:hypothetical protein